MSITGPGAAGGASFDTAPATSAAPDASAAPADATPVSRGSAPRNPFEGLTPPKALAEALSNDDRGLVSERDARGIVDAALAHIASSDDPQAAFDDAKRAVAAARIMLGSDPDAAKILDSYTSRGADAVDARRGELAGATVLPLAVSSDFAQLLEDIELVSSAADVQVTDVRGDAAQGYTFQYTAGGQSGEGFAVEYSGGWFLSPSPVDRATLDAATDTMRSYFDAEFGPSMRNDWGVTADEVAAARDAIRPERAYFPGESSDPYDLVSTYPIVMTFNNASGSDHGFFVGIDPSTGASEAYDFN